MSVNVLCRIHDLKAKTYHNIFTVQTLDEARRSLAHAVKTGQGAYSHFPEDYTLCEVGTDDPDTGTSTMLPAPIHHETAAQLASTERPDNTTN